MLLAKKPSIWKNHYEISADGRPVTMWDPSWWKSGGTFRLAGRLYEVSGNVWGTKYTMATEGGTVVASAERVGRKRWTVTAEGKTYEFQRTSVFRHEEELHVDGRRVGSINRPSMWSSDTVVDLPGLPVQTQVFVLAVVLTKWASAAAASTASHSSFTG